MIVIIATELDEVAQTAVAQWPGADATLLRPRDLCAPGWRVEVGRVHDAMLVASGERRAVSSVTGIVNRMAMLDERELVSIEPSDRRYVAAELNALLFYMLSQLPCRMVNRPCVNNLGGCDWRLQEWAYFARRHDVPMWARDAETALPSIDSMRRTVVLDGEVIQTNDERYADCLVDVVASADVTFADLCYSVDDRECVLRSVSLQPDLSQPEIVTAVHRWFGAIQ